MFTVCGSKRQRPFWSTAISPLWRSCWIAVFGIRAASTAYSAKYAESPRESTAIGDRSGTYRTPKTTGSFSKCLDKTADVSIYEKNRKVLYDALTEYGYTVIKPDGAFYMFVKSPEEDANKFCETAKKYELLLVPSDDFGVKGFVRISYCVSPEQIKNSLPAFKKLIEEYK